MTPKERAYRKQLLLLKGDALRMQVRIEMGRVRTRFDFVTLAGRILQGGSQLGALFTQHDKGWRGWLRQGVRLIQVWKTLGRLFGQR